jgi:hypothetical protein
MGSEQGLDLAPQTFISAACLDKEIGAAAGFALKSSLEQAIHLLPISSQC